MAKKTTLVPVNDHEDTDMPGAPESTALALGHGLTMQSVSTPYTTALSVQRPRVLHDVRRRLLEEAALAGEDFYYGWGTGKDRIEGASIELAVAAARCWGNCATDMRAIQELANAWIFTAIFIDLETGYTRTRQFRQSKTSVIAGRHTEERKADMRFQIGQSKAERNVILKALPAALIHAALEVAKQGVREQLKKWIADKTLPKVCEIMQRALAKLGVQTEHILAKFGVASLKALTIDHLVILKGDLAALQAGREYAEDLFPAMQVSEEPAPATRTQPAAAKPGNAVEREVARLVAHIEARRNTLGMADEAFATLCRELEVDDWQSPRPEELVRIAARLDELVAR